MHLHYDKNIIFIGSYISVGFAITFNFENYISIEELYKFKYQEHCNEDCNITGEISCYDSQRVKEKFNKIFIFNINICI